MLKVLPIGGRIKSASVGLDHLYQGDVDQEIARLRRDPLPELSMAFFPRVSHELSRMLNGIGFFRPTLKTDQGMAGNFLPFYIDPTLEKTDLSVRTIAQEEGAVIPEAWAMGSHDLLQSVRASFRDLDLAATYRHINGLPTRRAEKGRLPFFFIRPALTDRPIIFGKDIIDRVGLEVEAILLKAVETEGKSMQFPPERLNIIYCQADVYILADGTITVEALHFPDVGLFFADFETENSAILPVFRELVGKMREAIVDRILQMMGKRITIVTRDEVYTHLEDVLEMREIDSLRRELSRRGAYVDVAGVSHVQTMKRGSRLLLLNVDHKASDAWWLSQRHMMGEIECFPSPLVRGAGGIFPSVVHTSESDYDQRIVDFLTLAASKPSSEEGWLRVRERILRVTSLAGLWNDIVHADLADGTMPVFRPSLRSWRMFASRLSRPDNRTHGFTLRELPARRDNLLLTSSTGPRLHVFRFMCVAE